MANVVELSELTKNDFDAYERVRKSGWFNMLTESYGASRAARLDLRTYSTVLNNYSDLAEMYKK